MKGVTRKDRKRRNRKIISTHTPVKGVTFHFLLIKLLLLQISTHTPVKGVTL